MTKRPFTNFADLQPGAVHSMKSRAKKRVKKPSILLANDEWVQNRQEEEAARDAAARAKAKQAKQAASAKARDEAARAATAKAAAASASAEKAASQKGAGKPKGGAGKAQKRGGPSRKNKAVLDALEQIVALAKRIGEVLKEEEE